MYDEKKWEDLNRVIEEAKRDGIQFLVLSRPELLGDTVEDIRENLKRLGESGVFIIMRKVFDIGMKLNNRIKRFM